MATSPGTGTGTERLGRTMGLRELVAYGMIFVGPGAVVVVFGTLDALSGGTVPLVYIVATVAIAFTAMAYVWMSKAVPHAGSVFAYAGAGIGPRTGFIAGWMLMLDYLLIPALAHLFVGIALHSIFQPVPAWVFTVLSVTITTALNLAGVRIAAKVTIVVLCIELVVMAAVIVSLITVLATHGASRPALSPLVGYGGFAVGGVITAASVAVLSFLGFDGIASFAEDNAGDPKLVGRATLVCLLVCGALLVALAYLGALVTPVTPAEYAANSESQGTAYYDLVRTEVSWLLSTALATAKGTGAAFAAMVAQAAASRLLFGMARDGRLPRGLAAVSERSGSPGRATLVIAGFTVVVGAGAAAMPDGLNLLSSVVNVGALSAFTLLHASVIGYFVVRKRAAASAWHLIVPLLGAAVILAVLAGAHHTAQLVALTWLLAGLLVLAAQSRRPARAGR
ncbi:APC family permease [Pseudonocardia acaciae]|uniref:APC family permease n=1 Tax=Pseudonocardia acaciae TaxID=551276 RepID=UPI000491B5AE|nr:APC family permease [Pseudonocardia acaciae]